MNLLLHLLSDVLEKSILLHT